MRFIAIEADHPLKILVVNWLDRENPQSGGAEHHLHQIFGAIAAAGHEVTLLCSGWRGCDPHTKLDGIDVHRVGRRYTFSLYARRYFKRRLSELDFDVIVEDLNKVPLFTPWWSDVPVVLLVHHLFGRTAFKEANPLVAGTTWLLEKPIPFVFRKTPTIAVSESTREDLVERGLRPSHIKVIPNGIDVEQYSPSEDETRFEVPSLLYIGRLKRYKRVDLVVRAVQLLVGRQVDVTLRVAGEGDQRQRLEALAATLGVSDRVHFMGFVEDPEKLELLQRSWLHVLTSPKEGWGISNIEAAACGTPTVASNSPGLRESVKDGTTGILVPHGDVSALADAIESLLSDPEKRKLMGIAAREFAENFSWHRSAQDLLAALEDEVDRNRVPA